MSEAKENQRMEWERKFYDIVRETESTLANARRKLHGSSLSVSHSPDQSSLPYQPSSAASTSFVNNNDHINSIRRQMGWSVPSPSPSHSSALTVASHPPFSNELRELQAKIDSQSQMIENLEQLVKSLNREKDQYRRQITHLQNEVGSLNTRLSDSKNLNPQLKTQVDLVRQEVRSDIQRLQSLISSGQPSPNYSTSLENSFKDMQRSVHTELEELRRELNSMIHRVGKLELGLPSRQRVTHNRLNENKGSLGTSDHLQRSSSYFPTSSTSPFSTGDLFQVKELRSTVSQLHDKLDCLEGRVSASQSSSSLQSPSQADKLEDSKSLRSDVNDILKEFLNGVTDNDDDTDLDDLDLSEDLDLDTPFNTKTLSDDVDDIVEKTTDVFCESDDGSLSDDLGEDINIRKPRSVRNKTVSSYRSRGKATPRRKNRFDFEQPSTSSHAKDFTCAADVLSGLDVDHDDLDASADPFDLDSLDGQSADLDLDDL